MRLIITVLLSLVFSQSLLAFGADDSITRIKLEASDKVEYESRFLTDPSRLIVKFKTENISGRLVEDAELMQGAIRRLKVFYYPISAAGPDSRRIKFLTVWFNEGSSYKIWEKGNVIYLDFKGPNFASSSKEIEISDVINIKDTGLKARAVETILSQFKSGPATTTPYRNPRDILWILAFLLTAVYVLYFRAESWRRFIGRLEEVKEKRFPTEKRKWWRHSLAPLKDKAIYANISSFTSSTQLDIVPNDLGYGGMGFECSRLKKLDGELDIKLFAPDKTPFVQLKGVVVWQRNNWNLLKKHIGVAFTTLPEAAWSGINSYIEQQYAAL
ncbi:MAG: PilZ domain-containing protein [Candidatus Omnitrophica bacterium]|nr:PilZ domain-containing protein [Candidatus Omnitrophota bacterium]